MNKQELKISYIVLVVMSVGLFFLDWRYTTGYLLGGSVSYLLYRRNERFCDTVLSNQATNKWGTFFHFLNNYALMAIVLLLGVFLPDYINIFAVALGLFLLKTAVIINVFVHRKESNK